MRCVNWVCQVRCLKGSLPEDYTQYSFVQVKVEMGSKHKELRASLDHLRRKARCRFARFCLTRDEGEEVLPPPLHGMASPSTSQSHQCQVDDTAAAVTYSLSAHTGQIESVHAASASSVLHVYAGAFASCMNLDITSQMHCCNVPCCQEYTWKERWDASSRIGPLIGLCAGALI